MTNKILMALNTCRKVLCILCLLWNLG